MSLRDATAYLANYRRVMRDVCGVWVGSLFKVRMKSEGYYSRLISHHIAFLTDQSNKGSLLRDPTISDLLEAVNSFQHSMKVQLKTPDAYKTGWIHDPKTGQPIQVASSAWIHFIAGYFRLFTDLIFNAMSDKLHFVGPNSPMEFLHAKLFRWVDPSNLWGADVTQCDASHIPIFREFVRELIEGCYPWIPSEMLDVMFKYLAAAMDVWFCRTRSGSAKAEVWGQLASGSPWTFIWNCLWSLFQLSVAIRETRPLDWKVIVAALVAAACGDDLFASPVGHRLTFPAEYTTGFRVTLKMSFEPFAVIFCHHTFTVDGVFLDPVRTLAKFLAKPTDGSVEQCDEAAQAVHVLTARFRDPSQLACLAKARFDRFGHSPALTCFVMDLLWRFSNTPGKKLRQLLHPVRLVAAHYRSGSH
jgi:hypothetical protein